MKTKPVFVYKGEALAKYNFGSNHPFGPERHDAFHEQLSALMMGESIKYQSPKSADVDQLALFHTSEYIDKVSVASKDGRGFLDHGDTPAVAGIFEAACNVVGTTLSAVDSIMNCETKRAFVPIGGLHHAMRDRASGFCVFNDCGIAVEHLRKNYNIQRIAYIDIDAHHGDGMYYPFQDDPNLIFADVHQDGRTIYPGTGDRSEIGTGQAKGTKLNIPLPVGANDGHFQRAWTEIQDHLESYQPEFIILQCGADSLAGDPITQLELSEKSHHMAAKSLSLIAEKCCQGKLVALGGGGYNLDNIAKAWTAVVEGLID